MTRIHLFKFSYTNFGFFTFIFYVYSDCTDTGVEKLPFKIVPTGIETDIGRSQWTKKLILTRVDTPVTPFTFIQLPFRVVATGIETYTYWSFTME